MAVIPYFAAARTVSSNGKNASEPQVTPVACANHASFASFVNTAGFSVKIFSHSVCAHSANDENYTFIRAENQA